VAICRGGFRPGTHSFLAPLYCARGCRLALATERRVGSRGRRKRELWVEKMISWSRHRSILGWIEHPEDPVQTAVVRSGYQRGL
ncbi:hypothetical protein LINPERHAP1_LOCUS31118, partial [Linum perenne]